MRKPARRRPRRSLRNTGAKAIVLHCSHPNCKRTWDFFSSICDVHNRRLGGFESYTVRCGHPRCRETLKHTFYQPLGDAEGASYSASIEAISQGGWGMAAGKSLRCPKHSRVEKKVVLHNTIAKDDWSSDQVVFGSGFRIEMPSEYFSTVRAMRGKRVKITITLDD